MSFLKENEYYKVLNFNQLGDARGHLVVIEGNQEKGVPFDKTRVYPSETWFRFVEDRKPLLLIYLIDIGAAEENQKKQEAEFKAAMGNTPAVGLALGLPRNDEEAGLTSTRYKVNRVYNWFDREEMEDILAEGREE